MQRKADEPIALPVEEMPPKNDHTTPEYDYGTIIAGELRGNTNATLGNILTIVESVMGDSKQAEATKQLVKQELWSLTDRNQHSVYRALNVE